MSKVVQHYGDGSDLDVKQHIARYFIAVHGPNYGYRAPETFDSVLERWMWAVLFDDPSFADLQMGRIEQKMEEIRNQ